MLLRRGNYEQAELALSKALALNPTHSEWLRLSGTALQQLQFHSQALNAHRSAVASNPEDPMAHLSLALSLLLHERYAEAWLHYEWRLRSVVRITVPEGLPRWDGKSPVPQLLVVAEQGIGDLIMIMRYFPMLSLVTQQLSVVASPAVRGLLEASGFCHQVAAFGEDLDIHPGACWVPMMSLLEIIGIRHDDVLVNDPYLFADPQRVAHWRKSLLDGERFLVGLGWQGNPEAETGPQVGRSLALNSLAPLADVPGVSFMSLQKGPGAEQLSTCAFCHRFIAAQNQVDPIWNLEDTLAFLALCDLVITTDTALAHLAGALGRPTWILLKAVPDWRWGMSGEYTPWYPSVRLFRQSNRGDWEPVIERIHKELMALVTTLY